MTKKLAEAVSGHTTNLQFYVDQNDVVFEYRGPFDVETGDWIDNTARFPQDAFLDCIDALKAKSEASVAGKANENINLMRNPDGTIRLKITGCAVGSDLVVSSVKLPWAHMAVCSSQWTIPV